MIEYKNFFLDSDDHGKLANLNQIGKDGWILCSEIKESSVTKNNRPQCVALFYRYNQFNSDSKNCLICNLPIISCRCPIGQRIH